VGEGVSPLLPLPILSFPFSSLSSVFLSLSLVKKGDIELKELKILNV
jgi:hypothetical protein